MRYGKPGTQRGTGAKRLAVISGGAGVAVAAMIGIAAMSAPSALHSASPPSTSPAVASPAVATPAASPAVASPAASPAVARPAARSAAARPAAARPDTALARAFRKYFRQQAASGMTAWIKTGIEQRNQAILIQARADAFPHRDAALPADSAALRASARAGLARPSPVDTAGWDKMMRDEVTIAAELPIPSEGDAATALDPIIEQDLLAFALATS